MVPRIGKPRLPIEAVPLTLSVCPEVTGAGHDPPPPLIDQVMERPFAALVPTVPGATPVLTRQVSLALERDHLHPALARINLDRAGREIVRRRAVASGGAGGSAVTGQGERPCARERDDVGAPLQDLVVPEPVADVDHQHGQADEHADEQRSDGQDLPLLAARAKCDCGYARLRSLVLGQSPMCSAYDLTL